MSTQFKTVTLNFLRSTKNTHVYTDSDPNTVLPSQYIKKTGLPTPAPLEITVTIEWKEEG